MKVSWVVPISGIGIVVVILLSLFNVEQQEVPTRTFVEPSENVIIPKITSLEQKTTKITSTSEKASAIENIRMSSVNSNIEILKSAHAVLSDQLEITVNEWDSGIGGKVRAFDNQGNFFLRPAIPNKIPRVDVSTNTVTQWTLPNSGLIGGGNMGIDSLGNVYFGQSEDKLGRLNPNTDVFTEWQVTPPNVLFVGVDPFDNVYFSSGGTSIFLSRLDLSTNTVTSWFGPPGPSVTIQDAPFVFDSLGNVYFVIIGDPSRVGKLDVATNTLTEWPLPVNTEPNGIAVDPNGIIFITETHAFFNKKIARIDPSTNVLTEWLMPESITIGAGTIAADLNGNVFFRSDSDFVRLVPSTNIITEWALCAIPMKIDSSNVIHFGCNDRGGTIT